MPPLQAEHVTVDGQETSLLAGGDPTATEAVVFVHGNPGSAEHWRDLARRLPPDVRVVAPDLPGFGDAPGPGAGEATAEGFARRLDAQLTALGVERVHLVAHDIGGLVGLVWAEHRADALASLTLVDIGVLRGYRPHALALLWRTPGVGELVMRLTSERLLRLLLRRGQPRPLPDAFLKQVWRDLRSRRTQRTVLGFYRSADIGPVAERVHRALRAFAGPVLVMWGGADPYVGVEHAERQRETFPHAQVTVLERSGHWPYADDPDGFAAAVVPFLRRALRGPARDAG